MPRKNKRVKHTPFQPVNNDQGKRRYATKREAEVVAEHQMLIKSDLSLRIYKGLDGGWYLTRQKDQSP